MTEREAQLEAEVATLRQLVLQLRAEIKRLTQPKDET